MRLLLVLGLLLTLLPGGAAQAQAQAQPRLALVIGNQNYRPLPALDNALADARAIAATLRERSFDVTDLYDQDRVGMLRAFDAFRRRIIPGSIVVFYFSGHGLALDGVNYLLPIEMERENEELARYNALPLQDVMDGLATQNNRRERGLNLLIIDACRDNPFRNYTKSGGAPAGLSTKSGAGLIMLYAASSGQAALDRLDDADRDPNGVFTRSLLRAMRTPGLEVSDVARRVQREVGAISRGRQVPAFYSEALGDYVFTPGGPPAADAVLATPAPSPPERALPPQRSAALAPPVIPAPPPFAPPAPANRTHAPAAPPAPAGDGMCPPVGTVARYREADGSGQWQHVHGGPRPDAPQVCELVNDGRGLALGIRAIVPSAQVAFSEGMAPLVPLEAGRRARFSVQAYAADNASRLLQYDYAARVTGQEQLELAGRRWTAWVITLTERVAYGQGAQTTATFWKDIRTGLLLQIEINHASSSATSLRNWVLESVDFPGT